MTWDEDRGTTSPTNAQFCEDWAETDTHVNGSTSSIIIGNIVSLLMKNSLTSFPSLPLNQSLNFWFTLALTFHWRFVKEHGTLSRLPSIAVMCFSNNHLLLFYMEILKGVTNEGPLWVKMFFCVVEVEQQVLVSRYFFCFRACSRIY